MINKINTLFPLWGIAAFILAYSFYILHGSYFKYRKFLKGTKKNNLAGFWSRDDKEKK